MITPETVFELLRNSGMRVTQARKQLIEVLMSSTKALSIEQLFKKLSEAGYDQVTLYRNLEALDNLGILLRVNNEEGRELFLLNPEKDHYHVILCRECHKTETMNSCTIHSMEEFAKDRGFQQVSHTLELYGTCEECCSD